jgi:hypothetical protein
MNKYEHIIVPESIKRAIKYSPRGSGGGGLSYTYAQSTRACRIFTKEI